MHPTPAADETITPEESHIIVVLLGDPAFRAEAGVPPVGEPIPREQLAALLGCSPSTLAAREARVLADFRSALVTRANADPARVAELEDADLLTLIRLARS